MKPLALLLALFVLSSCTVKKNANVFIDPSLAILVPADTIAMVGVRLDKIKATPVYQKYIAQRKIQPLDDLAGKTGLDPRRDFYELLFCSDGKQNVLFIHGKFGDAFGKAPEIKIDGSTRTRYKGYELIAKDDTALMFMNSSVLVVGPQEALKRIVDNRDADKPGVPAQLLPLVQQIPYSTQMWAVSLDPASLANFPSRTDLGNANRMLQSMQNLVFTLDLRTGVNARLEGSSKTVDDANQIRSLLRGLIGMGRLSTPANKPELLRFFDAIRVEQQGQKVKVVVEASPDLIETAAKMFPQSMQ